MFSEPVWSEYDLNLGLILGVKHNFIIDTGLGSGSVAPIIDHLQGDGKPIIVVNTHADWDHHWGNFVFEDSLIIAHKTAYEIMSEHWDKAFEHNKAKADGEVRKHLPNLVFEGELYFADDGIKIIHTPGHTPCSISILDTIDKVLYVGDNFGDTAEQVLPEIHTDLQTFGQTLNIYKGLDVEVFVCGHNKPQKRDFLLKMEESWKKIV